MKGGVIADVEVRRPDLRWPFPERMANRLEGQIVRELRRRSKYILADLSSGETLIIHLGMSGRMLISGVLEGGFYHPQGHQSTHDHVVIHMGNGARITFNDARRFGAMDLAPTDHLDDHWLLRTLGPEPLGNAFNEDHLINRFAGRRTPIKSALLDQKVVAGLGNIYVCEALHRARINPKRHAGRVSKRRVAGLVPVVRDVLSEAIEAGGSSLRDHRKTDGELGYFQHSFRVYDREGQACCTPDCGGSIKRIIQSGRSTFYCTNCQR